MQAMLLLILAAVPGGDGVATVDFDNDIIPVLTKAGCNAGACHGAAAGRGGLRLSLFGSDPELDHRAIALDREGRRVNLFRPERSLLLLKATESIAHGGGSRIEIGGPEAARLSQWIAQGVPRLRLRRLAEFQVSPQSQVVDAIKGEVQLSATARFDDGSSRDVTPWTVFFPEDPTAVQVDPVTAVARLLRRGRHVVVARYLDQVKPIEFLVPLADTAVDLADQPRRNFIDEHILDRLSVLRLPVSPPVDDATFLRRAMLDLAGRLPTVEQFHAFVDDPRVGKRERLVDELLGSDEFTEYWAFRLSRLLRVRSPSQEPETASRYHQWLTRQIAERVSYRSTVRTLLTATGDTRDYGPANFYRTVRGAREQAEFVSELFMGSRLRCANCHNHPLDRWTQDDYHGLAAIFARIEQGAIIRWLPRGEVTHPRTGEPAVPRIPGERFVAEQLDGRMALADWLTSRDNPYFAKSTVNRLWKALMGRGLVEPTDDFRATNPASHPQLLQQLADDFAEHGYDLRHTLRRIAHSAAFARSARPLNGNRADDQFYSHALIRSLEPEVLADAISDLLGVPDQYGAEPLGTRAVALFDGSITAPSLDILGRCSPENSCENRSGVSGGLPLQLHLLNGRLINARLSDPGGRLAKRIAAHQRPEQIVDEFYLAAFSRHPSPVERAYWREQLTNRSHEEMVAVLEDVVWSLVSCREFGTQH